MSETFDGNLMRRLSSKFGGAPRKTRGASLADRLVIEKEERGRIDGRTLRRTGRTEQFAAASDKRNQRCDLQVFCR